MLQVKDTATRMLTNFSVQAGTNDFYTAQRLFKDPGVKALPQVSMHQAWPTNTCTPASMCVNKASACLPCGQLGHSHCVCERRHTATFARTRCLFLELAPALLPRNAICCAVLCVCVTGCGG